MTDRVPFFNGFVPPSLSQWRGEVERLLRGATFDDVMFTAVGEGFKVAPIYTEADVQDIPWRESLPGQAPFVRGAHAAGYHGRPWLVAQEYRYPTGREFNEALREALSRGQTAINLVLDEACKRGRDPDQISGGEVGDDGTSVCSLADLAEALAGIDLGQYPLLAQTGASALPVGAMVAALVLSRGGDLADLQGCLGSDPYAGLARWGRINTSVAQIHDELAVLSRWAAAEAPRLRTLPVFECPWHNGGADLALSLGLLLSAAVGTLRAMEERGIAPTAAAPRFQFNLEIGTDFFMETAKLRVLRLLWSRILSASGVPPEQTSVMIHARTGRRNLTRLDPQVNMLRVTTAAMSAVLGGCDSLHVSPYDEVGGYPDVFSHRIARNVHLILAREIHLDQVTDPAGGAWYVENLTRDLANAAWHKFQAVEREGGIQAVLASGWAQEQVAVSAAVRSRDLATRREIMVGVNKFPAPGTIATPCHRPDPQVLSDERVATLKARREAVTPEDHLRIVSLLGKVSDCPPEALFDLLVEAARAGATLGEFTEMMRAEGRCETEVTPIPVRRAAAPFEVLRDRAAALGDAARVCGLCLGKGHDARINLEFGREIFAVGGFAWTEQVVASQPPESGAAVAADGASVVVVAGGTNLEHAVEWVQALAAVEPPPLVVFAGDPGPMTGTLRAAGVCALLAPGQDILLVLNDLVDRLVVLS